MTENPAMDNPISKPDRGTHDPILELLSRATAAEQRSKDLVAALSEARGALEPFTKVADEYGAAEDDHFQVWKDFDPLGDLRKLTLAKFRAARSALAKIDSTLSRHGSRPSGNAGGRTE